MNISERVLKAAKRGGYIAVDFDGTMFTFPESDDDAWLAWNVFGEPIWPMIDRIRAWLTAGIEVRVFTARIGLPVSVHVPGQPVEFIDSKELLYKCQTTGTLYSAHMMANAIQDHLEKHHLPRLKVQCYKDAHMIEFWDDRAVQVLPNQGVTLHQMGEDVAQRGRQFDSGNAQQPEASKTTDKVPYAEATCGCNALLGPFSMIIQQTYYGLIKGNNICREAEVPAFEMSILAMAACVALRGTIIQPGSDEAKWEIDRVLTGLEGRLLSRAADYHADIQKMGLPKFHQMGEQAMASFDVVVNKPGKPS